MNEQTTSPTLTREALEKRRKSLVEERDAYIAFLRNGRHGKYDQCVLERGQ